MRNSTSLFAKFLTLFLLLFRLLVLVVPVHGQSSFNCTEFDSACQWQNADPALIPSISNATQLLWYRSSVAIDPVQMLRATGTNSTPNGTYAIAATDTVDSAKRSQVALLISGKMPCQIQLTTLSFNYWTSPHVMLKVCARLVTTQPQITFGNGYSYCNVGQKQGPNQGPAGPGPASVTFLPSGAPFYIIIEASNFTYTNGTVSGGLVILDNLKYSGNTDYNSNCTMTTTTSVPTTSSKMTTTVTSAKPTVFPSNSTTLSSLSTTRMINMTTTSTTTMRPPLIQNSSMISLLKTHLREGTVLHVWLRAQRKGEIVFITWRKLSPDGNRSFLASAFEADPQWFEFREIALEYEGEVEISWSLENINVSYVYAYEPEKVQIEGIRPLYISLSAKLPADLTSFHFAPPLGWMNDPNGFSRSADGVYHLFYQHYPHSQQWWAMHWGHAVSTDLFNWIHQPIMIRPTKDQMNGGIFSGSAKPEGTGLRIYYTDHSMDRNPMQYQRSVLTKDMISPIGPKQTALAKPPKGLNGTLTKDFRDPYVFTGPNSQLYMLLGSRFVNLSAGVILLYNHSGLEDEPKGWQFQKILKAESRWNIASAECTAMIPLGDPDLRTTPWVLLLGAQNSVDEKNRTYLSTGTLGTFDGQNFVQKSERLLDFMSGSYGYTAFYDSMENPGEALLIGWLGNWNDVQPKVPYPTTMTVPRLMKLAPGKNTFLTLPHPNIAYLHAQELNASNLLKMKPLQLPDGTADLQMELSSLLLSNGLTLNLNHTMLGPEAVKIITTEAGVEVKLKWRPNAKYIAPLGNGRLRVLIDLRSVEVFVGDGLAAGTARFPSAGCISTIQFVGSPNLLKSAQIWSMESTQFKYNIQ